jgi:hypothetical protein
MNIHIVTLQTVQMDNYYSRILIIPAAIATLHLMIAVGLRKCYSGSKEPRP